MTEIENEETDGVGVFCKCGGIIYCCTDDCYNNRDGKEKIDLYFDDGYKVGRVTKTQVSTSFGCKCKKKNQ